MLRTHAWLCGFGIGGFLVDESESLWCLGFRSRLR